ncbi:MAG: ATP-binding protein [Pseudomonadota bacterium]
MLTPSRATAGHDDALTDERDIEAWALIARELVGASTAFIALLDADDQWTILASGELEHAITTGDALLPTHRSACNEPLVRPAHAVERNAAKPIFTGGPANFAFLIRVPLKTGNADEPIGVLGVVDPQPKTINQRQYEAILALAGSIARTVASRPTPVRHAHRRTDRAAPGNHRRKSGIAVSAPTTKAVPTLALESEFAVTDDVPALRVTMHQVARALSHDLSEPIRTIGSYVELIERRYLGEINETADRYLGFAATASRRLQARVHDIATLARMSTQDLCPEWIDTQAEVQSAVAELGVSDETFDTVVSENLPIVRVHRPHFQRLMRELLTNAVKFSDPARRLTVCIASESTPTWWKFSVRDNGIGIAPIHLEDVFTLFRQLHPAGDYPGAGVGLAFCRCLVERNGGRIYAQNVAGPGTVFEFRLPRHNRAPERQIEASD